MSVEKSNSFLQRIWQKSGIEVLSPREKWVLSGGIIFVLGFIVVQFVITPFLDAKSKRIQSISIKQAELIKIKELSEEYLALKTEEDSIQGRIENRESSFTLFTFLDTQAGKAGVKKRIKYMKPSLIEGDELFDEMMVEMKLQQVELAPLVNFLRLIENDEEVVFVSRLSIQESGSGGNTLDVILQIATFQVREKG